MFNRITDNARKVMQLANKEARRLGHEHVDDGDVLCVLVQQSSGSGAELLSRLGIDSKTVLDNIATRRGKLVPKDRSANESQPYRKLPQTNSLRRVIDRAISSVNTLGHDYLGTEHLVLGMLGQNPNEGYCLSYDVLTELGANYAHAERELGLL